MKKIFLIFTTISLIAGVGCKKGYLDINTNPNQSTSADPSLVLPAALVATVANYYPGPTTISEWMQSWAVSGSYAINGNDPGFTYKMTTGFGDGFWQSVYDNLEDYQYIQKSANASGNGFLEGIARIMKAFNYMHLVDLWGDIPYSDALRGALSLRPKYDKGVDVYDSLFNELQAGITLINNSGATISATSDVMFGGDKTSWVQFANTVRLEMLLRMSQMATKPDFFQPNLALTQSEPAGFLAADALVQPGYTNSSGQGNPFWQRFYNLTGGLVSSFGDFWAANIFAVNYFQSNNDPRLGRVYTGIKYPLQWVGCTVGLANNNPTNGNYSVFGPGLLRGYDIKTDQYGFDSLYTVNTGNGSTAPAVMMLASESYFLQAEAVVLGYITGDAKSLYESGVTASFEYYGAQQDLKKVPDSNGVVRDSVRLTPDESATNYYSQNDPRTNFALATTPAAQQSLILRQKWAALIGINSFESYDDYRKFDNLHTGTAPFAGPLGDTPMSASPYIDVPKIPIRWLYPQSEYSKNPDNVPALFDHQTSKIFWMQ